MVQVKITSCPYVTFVICYVKHTMQRNAVS